MLWLRRRRASASIIAFFILTFWFLFLREREAPELDPKYGLLSTTHSHSKVAVVTYLTDDLLKDKKYPDAYFTSARLLTYQLLHDPETKFKRPIPFVILANPKVSEARKERLRADGAAVIEVEDIPTRWWIKTGVARWQDQFTKLRLFEWTQYDRILFLDADTFITQPLDELFQELEVTNPIDTFDTDERHGKADEALLPSQYLFAARSDNALTGKRLHPFPPLHTDQFSAGFWVVAPSKEMFKYLMSVMDHYKRFDPHAMEQSLLNYAFRRDGPIPWRELNYRWSATWPSDKDLNGKVATLHEKPWRAGPKELRRQWRAKKAQMDEFYAKKAVD